MLEDKPIRRALLIFLAGGLAFGGVIGAASMYKIQTLSQENTRLLSIVKKQGKYVKTLEKDKSELSDEYDGFKQKQAQLAVETEGTLKELKTTAQIDALYQLGLKALEKEDFPRAFYALEQVLKSNKEYKAVEKHYLEAKTGLEKENKSKQDEKLAATYLKAFDFQGHGQLAQAKKEYQAVVAQNPKYKDAQKRLETVTKQLELQTKQQELKSHQDWLAKQYEIALAHQKDGRYTQAKVIFEQIVSDSPKYKDASDRLVKVIAQIPAQTVAQAQPASDGTAPKTPTADDIAVLNKRCFDKGAEYGTCYMLISRGKVCDTVDLENPPQECKGSAAFKRGIQSTAPTGATVILRGLSNFLKEM